MIFQKVKEWSLMVGFSNKDRSHLTGAGDIFPVISGLATSLLFLHYADGVKRVDFAN